MKYRKGNQTEKLDDLPLQKVGLVREGIDGEGPWIRQGSDYVVLQNHAIHFFPFPSWGMILPSVNPSGELREEIEISQLVKEEERELHPEAWASYLERGEIDEEGNYIQPEEEEEEEDE